MNTKSIKTFAFFAFLILILNGCASGQFKKTKTGLFIAYCKKCNKKNYPNDYQLKQSSCCGVDWSPNQVN